MIFKHPIRSFANALSVVILILDVAVINLLFIRNTYIKNNCSPENLCNECMTNFGHNCDIIHDFIIVSVIIACLFCIIVYCIIWKKALKTCYPDKQKSKSEKNLLIFSIYHFISRMILIIFCAIIINIDNKFLLDLLIYHTSCTVVPLITIVCLLVNNSTI
jgi:hypothetical protein